MLCSKCHKEIEKGKEIQVKGSIFCKDCAEKPIAYCDTCSSKRPLYYNDTIHESSRNSNSGFNLWIYSRSVGSSREAVQCDDCYKDWKKEVENWDKWWKLRIWILSVLTVSLLASTLFIFYPNVMDKFKNDKEWTFIFFVSLFVIIFILNTVPGVDRYKTRKRDKNKEKKSK